MNEIIYEMRSGCVPELGCGNGHAHFWQEEYDWQFAGAYESQILERMIS